MSAADHGRSAPVSRATITSSTISAMTHGSRIQAVPETLRAMKPAATRPDWERATRHR